MKRAKAEKARMIGTSDAATAVIEQTMSRKAEEQKWEQQQ